MVAIEEIDHTEAQGQILVSVCMITYGHEAFITEAIEGVLMQRLTGHVELVISDDLSPDATRGICKRYQERYPDRIRLVLPGKNIGVMPNFIQTLQKCRGKYIALCEGDDYWTDPLKLQKQVAIMDKDSSLAGSAHDVQFMDERSTGPHGSPFKRIPAGPVKLEDVAPTRSFHTASLMFRKELLYSAWWPALSTAYMSGDKVINLSLFQAGGIHFSTDVMAVYRRHSGGASTSSRLDKYMLSDVRFYKRVAKEFKGRQRAYLKECATYYRVARTRHRLGKVPLANSLLDHLQLAPFVGRSRFLSWPGYLNMLAILKNALGRVLLRREN